MGKVKMGDIKSSSTNVKSVFRLPMSSRTNRWLQRQTFTSEDILDIFRISEEMEYHKEKRDFHQRLIMSQKGPFSSKLFTVFAENLFAVEPMIHLIENSPSTTEEARIRWLDYTMVSSTHWFAFNFYSRDKGVEFGIDVTKAPYNKIYAGHIVRYADRMGRGNLIEEYFIELNRILDTMNENEIYEWYIDSVASTYADKAVDFIMNYDKMPTKVISHYYNKAAISLKQRLAKHENADPIVKQEMYEETGDDDYLPKDAREMFLF